MPAPDVIIRFGSHAEKEYVLKLATLLDGIIVGANLFETTPGATASLLWRMEAKHNKVYLDPMTYAFGSYIDPSTRELCTDLRWIKSEQTRKNKDGDKEKYIDFKRSYKRLGDEFGAPLDNAIRTSTAVSKESFSDPSVVKSFCKTVAQYQLDRIRREFEKDPELKDFADDAPSPTAVFAPYFYVEPSHTDDWLTLDLELMRVTASLNVAKPVHGVLCADVSHLSDKKFIARILDEIPKTGVAGIWLWFSQLFEDDVSTHVLGVYRDLVQGLAANVEVHSMHGGFFSLALSEYGMTSVSHGVGYGEQKNVVPIIGQSIPMVRYYLSPVLRKLGVPDIQRAFAGVDVQSVDDFHNKVCNCAICKGVVTASLEEFRQFGDMRRSRPEAQRMSQTPAAAKRCRYHFLLSRLKERDELRDTPFDQVLGRLTGAIDTWGAQPSLQGSTGHLERWTIVLESKE